MSAPTRILRCPPPHGIGVGIPARASASPPWTATACTAAATIERYQHLSTTTRPSQTPNGSPSRKRLTTLQTPTVSSPPPPPALQNQPPTDLFFTPHPLLHHPTSQQRPPDDRKVKLGKTLRILQDRLPTLLQTPLPQEVLSPHITLHLFPSTHPHLPTVTGRVAYIAALWSSPIAWNRVPLVGNVRLEILSERMVARQGMGKLSGKEEEEGVWGEQLIVRWRTVGGDKGWLGFVGNGKGKGMMKGGKAAGRKEEGGGGGGGVGGDGKAGGLEGSEGGMVKMPVGNAQAVGASNKEFTGLFIFDFDREGRILSHTIEHVQEGGQWEKGVGAKVVGLTDWLLGGMKGGEEPCPAFMRARFRKER